MTRHKVIEQVLKAFTFPGKWVSQQVSSIFLQKNILFTPQMLKLHWKDCVLLSLMAIVHSFLLFFVPSFSPHVDTYQKLINSNSDELKPVEFLKYSLLSEHAKQILKINKPCKGAHLVYLRKSTVLCWGTVYVQVMG